MSVPKRHHYIPAGYLKAFTFSGDSVFYFDKAGSEKGIRPRNRRKILKIPQFYSNFETTGSFDPVVEKYFAQEIDDNIPDFVKMAEGILDGIIKRADYFSVRNFSEELLLNFFYRSPYTREKSRAYRFHSISKLLLKSSFWVQNFRMPNLQELGILENNLIQDVIKTGHEDGRHILAKLNFCLVEPYSGEAFLTGSNPVVLQFPKGASILSKRKRLQKFYFLPLSPRSGVMFSDYKFNADYIALEPESSKILNSIVFGQSTKVVSHSEALLQSFVENMQN